METTAIKPKRSKLASLFAQKTEAQRRRADTRKRLRKKIDEDGIGLLTALFERLEHYAKGVDGEGFRIEFKERRGEIDRLLARSFIRESYEPTTKLYRPTLLGLALIDDTRAEEILLLTDRLLRYFAHRYETTRSQAITLEEMSEALAASQTAVANALGYVIEGPASGGRSSGLPKGAEWQFLPGANSLDYPSLHHVLAQLAAWAGQSGSPNPSPLNYQAAQTGRLRSVRLWRWVAGAAIVVGGALTVLANLATIASFFQTVFQG